MGGVCGKKPPPPLPLITRCNACGEPLRVENVASHTEPLWGRDGRCETRYGDNGKCRHCTHYFETECDYRSHEVKFHRNIIAKEREAKATIALFQARSDAVARTRRYEAECKAKEENYRILKEAEATSRKEVEAATVATYGTRDDVPPLYRRTGDGTTHAMQYQYLQQRGRL